MHHTTRRFESEPGFESTVWGLDHAGLDVAPPALAFDAWATIWRRSGRSGAAPAAETGSIECCADAPPQALSAVPAPARDSAPLCGPARLESLRPARLAG